MQIARHIPIVALTLALTASLATALTEETTPEAADAAKRAEAKKLFATRCAACHGPAGKGDGLAAAALTPKPRDFSDKEWQASVTDEYLEEIILKGGVALKKSPLMPPNPDLAAKKALLTAVREYVRSLRVDDPPLDAEGSE